jgi:hypothetical protein
LFLVVVVAIVAVAVWSVDPFPDLRTAVTLVT